MKVRVIKTPSFGGGGIYDGGYKLSPGEVQGMIKGYTGAVKSTIDAGKSFGKFVDPAGSLIRDTITDALTDPEQKAIKAGIKMLSPGLSMAGDALGMGDIGSLTGIGGSAAGAAGTAAGAAGTGAAAAGATGAASAAAGAAGAAGGAAGLISSLAPLAALASDRRVKENIERVGETFDGQNIYRFNYKGDPHTQLGLIAQEVEKTGNADSVYNVNGIKMVDYDSATEDAAQKGRFMNSGNRKKLSKTMTYAEGGTATDPQLLAAYRSIANELANGQDPNALVGQFVDNGMNYDDAQDVVSQVMDFMNPTSEESMPQAQIGGGTTAGMFAGQSTEPSHIIEKPVMKDGGHTFVTSQPAYTKKSVNYFGTSNAPARDSYTNNDEITTSVKAVPREDATIEAEKGEYIFSPQGLYKIEGKKHSKGGTPLAAKGGEFIFSAHRDMSIDPELQKEAGLKKHSSKALADNTPAKVLERNVDVKEYNRLKAIVENPKSDVVTKKTAQFMLEKMDSKIQVIAKLQEANKQPDPVEIKDQYIEQPQIQDDINAQKQFAHGGFNLPAYPDGGPAATGTTGTAFSGQETDVNSARSREQAAAYEKSLRDAGYPGPSITGLDYSIPHPEIKQAQEWAAQHFGPQIADYLRTQKPSRAVQKILNGKDIKDVSNEDLLKAYPDSYWSWRGYVPTAPQQPTGSTYVTGQQIGTKKEEEVDQDLDLDVNNKNKTSERVYTSGVQYDNVLKDPYDKIRGMQASQYLNNVVANKPYFTYAAPVNAPLTEAGRMSTQPLMDEAAKARYSANQLASKFGDSTQRMIGAAQQNDQMNKGLFEIGKYNTEAEVQNRNQNLLRSSAAANTWNDRMKQAYDQNTNVLDKMNFNNAAYYNQYSAARQKDILDKYYADRDLQTAYIPYLDTYDVKNPNGTFTKRVAAPTYLNGQPNPNWSGFGSSAVNKMALKQNNNTLKTTIATLKEQGFSNEDITKILGRQKLDE